MGHLVRQLRELRIATAAREDMETRPAAMYKQVEAKADAAAQAAGPAQALPSAPVGRSAVQSVAGPGGGSDSLYDAGDCQPCVAGNRLSVA